MKVTNALFALMILTSLLLLSSCDHGSKQAFSNSIRAAGHFDKK